ncbi:MAG: hypothetical protein HY735_36560 [Verrucomicrobia bacterium]|nr:hypothetical protein [Verrucomicrobiota bacterium]
MKTRCLLGLLIGAAGTSNGRKPQNRRLRVGNETQTGANEKLKAILFGDAFVGNGCVIGLVAEFDQCLQIVCDFTRVARNCA